ncbi:APC family permease [Massilia sp. TN1-12]|uniref:APC family permease n=1 Tax=Massilia paldalensis TaxID=3377675 RepID=UPI00384D85D4
MHDTRPGNDDSLEGTAAIERGDAPRAVLGLREAVTLIVGIVIGAGIFKAPAAVAAMTGSPPWMFLAWILGGVLSLVGALCYAELATSHAHAGGDYHFLRLAYGRSLAFLFGWARYAVITTGSIALLAFVFGDYLQQALPLSGLPAGAGAAVYAAAAVLVLALVNLAGIRSGSRTQNWLTFVEVGGLLLVGATALALAAGAGATPPPSAAGTGGPPAFGLAMVFVLLTYGGWNEAAYISAELRGGPRAMVRALVLSVMLITALYLLVCWAYWHTLGMAGLAASPAPAADVLRLGLGSAGGHAIALLVAVSALTSINATMIVGARTGYALGHDWPRLRRLARWNGVRGTPAVALLVQAAAAMLLVAAGSTGGDGFRAMVEFTAPVFWLFFLLTGIALFVLRRRDPARHRPYRVPWYPLLPLVFCTSCAAMLWASLSHVASQSVGGVNAAWVGVAVLAVGVLLLRLLQHDDGRRRRAAGEPLAPFDTHPEEKRR